jgi:hypothetical protein
MESTQDIKFDAIEIITQHSSVDNKNYHYGIVKNCMIKCIDNFGLKELSLNEEKCIQNCYLNKLENYFITKV